MRKFTVTLFLLLPLFSLYSQTTIHVPGDYSTIQAAIDAAVAGDIVLVAEDTYYENIDFNSKGITVASHFFLDGDKTHIENTIIDGSEPADSNVATVVRFVNDEDTTSVLNGFTITGGFGTQYSYREAGGIDVWNATPKIVNNIIEYNEIIANGNVGGSAISVLNNTMSSPIIIENNIIRNNLAESTNQSAYVNGTIYIRLSQGEIIIRNNIIANNVVKNEYISNGGGITAWGVNSTTVKCIIENNIFMNNVVTEGTASTAQLGGAIFMEAINAFVRNNIIAYNRARGSGGIHYWNPDPPNVTPTLENNTIYGNIAGSRGGGGISTSHQYDVVNCLIWGNSSPQFSTTHVASITYSNVEETYNGIGNITVEPAILDTIYFLLSDTSDCIDAGNPDPMYNDVEDPNNLGNPLWPALGSLTNDIGHCGGPNSIWAHLDPPVSVEDDEMEYGIPTDFNLSQNYPNPFNPTTTIKYSINEIAFIELKVYDILGNEIYLLVDEEQDAGFYKIDFNASKLSSGIYFYRLQAGSFVETKKMVLMK